MATPQPTPAEETDQVERPVASPDVLIVGAGFSGIGIAIRMLAEGLTDFLMLERADDVGGTWRENTYPGCACDIPSRVYSLSFAQNPDWSTAYPRQREIWDHMRATVDRFGVRPYLRLGHEMQSARWDDSAGRWLVRTNAGLFTSRVLITGTGLLTEPSIPDLPGLGSFEGKVFHTANWDADHRLEGERVAMIGTGASGVQVVPEIQPRVERLSVFQRTAPWIMPRYDRRVSATEKWIYRRFPVIQRIHRALHYWLLESRGFPFFVEPRTFPLIERIALRHLRKQVPDPELRARLTPDYTMGCKRILGSSTYYPALQAENSELITEAISEITAGSIRTADGSEREVDTIIFGTGFEVVDWPLGRVIEGRDGVLLNDAWGGTPEGYKGTTTTGFPNMFMLVGPNVGLGHNSVLFMIESQISYVLDALRQMSERRLQSVEVRAEEQRRFNERLQSKFTNTVWTSGCQSWYMNEEGRVHVLWPMSTVRFRLELARFDLAAYRATPSQTMPGGGNEPPRPSDPAALPATIGG
ncbi:MAG: NAD(P)/FAD-dependent oxidoreductase [Solirubrobacterales bacterium]